MTAQREGTLQVRRIVCMAQHAYNAHQALRSHAFALRESRRL